VRAAANAFDRCNEIEQRTCIAVIEADAAIAGAGEFAIAMRCPGLGAVWVMPATATAPRT